MSVPEAAAIEFSVPPVDQVLDLHGDPAHHDLALFVQGNQWMVLPELVRAFQGLHPEVGSVYYETLPSGILIEQMRRGALQMGELTIRVAPDVLTAGMATLRELAQEGWVGEPHEYTANTLAILVRPVNPLGICGWAGLLQPRVRVALPDPETEGIGRLVREAVVDTLGGGAWSELAGRALFTRIHHRETPLWLLDGRVDAGPVWLTEALYQVRIGEHLDIVRLPASQNRRGRYGAAVAQRACLHPHSAREFVEFLRGPAAQALYAAYGFEGVSDQG